MDGSTNSEDPDFEDMQSGRLSPSDVLASQRASNAQSEMDTEPSAADSTPAPEEPSQPTGPTGPTAPTDAGDAVRLNGPKADDTSDSYWAAVKEGVDRGILPTEPPRSAEEASQQQQHTTKATADYQSELNDAQRDRERQTEQDQVAAREQQRQQASTAKAQRNASDAAAAKAYAGQISDFKAAGGQTEHDAEGNVVPKYQANPGADARPGAQGPSVSGTPIGVAQVPVYKEGIVAHAEPEQRDGQWTVPKRDAYGNITNVPVDQSPAFREDPQTGAQSYRVNGEEIALGVNDNIVQRNKLKATQEDLLRDQQQDHIDLADARLRLKDADDALQPYTKPAKDAQTALDALNRQLATTKSDGAKRTLQTMIAEKQKILADPGYVAAQSAADTVDAEVRAKQDAINTRREQALQVARDLDKLKQARMLPQNVDQRLMVSDAAGAWPVNAVTTDASGGKSLDPGFAEVLAAGRRAGGSNQSSVGSDQSATSNLSSYRDTLNWLQTKGVTAVGDKPIADEIQRTKDLETTAENDAFLGSTGWLDKGTPKIGGAVSLSQPVRLFDTTGAERTAFENAVQNAAGTKPLYDRLDQLTASSAAVNANQSKTIAGRLTSGEKATLADNETERTALTALLQGRPEQYQAWSAAHPTDLGSQVKQYEADRDSAATGFLASRGHYAGGVADLNQRLEDRNVDAERTLEDPQAGFGAKIKAALGGGLGAVGELVNSAQGRNSADLAAIAKAHAAYQAIGDLKGPDAEKALGMALDYQGQLAKGGSIVDGSESAPWWRLQLRDGGLRGGLTLGQAQQFLDELKQDSGKTLAQPGVENFLRKTVSGLPFLSFDEITANPSDLTEVAKRNALTSALNEEIAKHYGGSTVAGSIAGGFLGWELGGVGARLAAGKLASMGALGQALKEGNDAVGVEQKLAAISHAANYAVQGTSFDFKSDPQSMGVGERLLSLATSVGSLAVSQELGGAAGGKLAALTQSGKPLPLTLRWLAHSAASGAGLIGGNAIQQVMEGQNPLDDQSLGANIGVAAAMGMLGVRGEGKMRKVWAARDAQIDALTAYARAGGVTESPAETALRDAATKAAAFSPEADKAKTALFGQLLGHWASIEGDPATYAQRHDNVNGLRGALDDARTRGDGAAVANFKDQLEQAQTKLADSAGMMLRLKPDVAAKAAKILAPDADGAGLTQHLADNDALRLASVEIGRTMRPLYLTGARGQAADQLVGGSPAKQAAMDQMVGAHAVTRDLLGVLKGGKIEADKAAAFEQLGLTRREAQPDGRETVRVTDDGLSLLPKAVRDDVASDKSGKFNVSVGAGNPGAIANNLVKSGEDRVRAAADGQKALETQRDQAVRAQTAADEKLRGDAEAAGKTVFHVPIAVTMPDIGERTTRIAVPAADEGEAARIALAQAKAGAPPEAGIRLAGRPAAVPAEHPTSNTQHPTSNEGKGKPAKVTQDQAGGVFGKVYAKWKDDLAQLGITKLSEVGGKKGDRLGAAAVEDKPNTKAPMGPLAVQGETLFFHRGELAKLINSAARRGVSPEEAVEGHIVHELIHGAALRTVSQAEAEEIAATAPKALRSLAAQAYANFDKLSSYGQGHELLRIVVEGRYRGKITEQIYRALDKVLKALGIDLKRLPENALLKETADRVKAVLDAHAIDISKSRIEQKEANGDELTENGEARNAPKDDSGTNDSAQRGREGLSPGAAAAKSGGVGGASGEHAGGSEAEQSQRDSAAEQPAARGKGSGEAPAGEERTVGGVAGQPGDGSPADEAGPSRALTAEEKADWARQEAEDRRTAEDQTMRQSGHVPLREAVQQLGGLPSAKHKLSKDYGEELARVRDAVTARNQPTKHTKLPGLNAAKLFSHTAESPDVVARRLGFRTGNELFAALEHEIGTGRTHWVNPEDHDGQVGTDQEALGAAPAAEEEKPRAIHGLIRSGQSPEQVARAEHMSLSDVKRRYEAGLNASLRNFRNASVTSGPESLWLGAARAYHGTRNKVDKFSLDRIGTGEGAQAYGWGLYFAESKDVAESYRTAGEKVEKSPARKAQVLEALHGESDAKSIAQQQVEDAQRYYDEARLDPNFRMMGGDQATRKEIKELEQAVRHAVEVRRILATPKFRRESTGNVYSVNLDVGPGELLDWDKPLSEQGDVVRERLDLAASKIGDPEFSTEWNLFKSEDPAGSAIYTFFGSWLDAGFSEDGRFKRGDAAGRLGSERLSAIGIPGIRYLDGNSRDRGGGTHNFVMFDDSKIQITHRNGQAVALREALGAAPAGERDLFADDTHGLPLFHRSNVDEAATVAHTEPSDAQKEAGNYRKGHTRISGLDISIENPAGSTRSGEDRNGNAWSTTMGAHYGYIRGTEGRDGDHVDVMIKPGTPEDWRGPVYVVNQVEPGTGRFDEHKAILGAESPEDARAIYQSNFAPGWRGLGSLEAMPFETFKSWASDPDATQRKASTSPEPAKSVAELVKDNMGLAVTIANSYRNIPGADFEDILGEARKALVKAARGFDPEQPAPFGAYAGRAIRNELNTLFGKETRHALREGESADVPVGDDEGAPTRKDQLEDPTAQGNISGDLEHEETRAAVREAMEPLPERVKTVLTMAGEGKSLREIGEAIGLSHEMARRILENGKKAVEARLRARGFQGQDADGVLYSAKAGDEDDRMPEDERAASTSGQPSPSGQVARGVAEARTGHPAQLHLFHGTTGGDFTKFDPEAQMRGDENNHRKGVMYLTDDHDLADDYSLQSPYASAEERVRRGEMKTVPPRPLPEGTRLMVLPGNGRPRVYIGNSVPPEFLTPSGKLKKGMTIKVELPNGHAIWDAHHDYSTPESAWRTAQSRYDEPSGYYDPGSRVYAADISLQNPLVIDAGPGSHFNGINVGGRGGFVSMAEMIDRARAAGHDGLIVRGLTDAATNPRRARLQSTVAVFDPAHSVVRLEKSAAAVPEESGGGGFKAKHGIQRSDQEDSRQSRSGQRVAQDQESSRTGNVNPESRALGDGALHSAPAVADHQREIGEEADRIEHPPADAVKPPEFLKDIIARGFAGRLDALDHFVPGAKALLTDAHIKNARISAALRIFRERVETNVKKSFGYPSWWREKGNAKRMERFTAELLPTAARLNAVSQDVAGKFRFQDFWMRAGELSGRQEKAMGLNGVPITLKEGVIIAGRHGEQLRVGEHVETTVKGKPRDFWQLERFLPAADQAKIHADFHTAYPEAAHWLDSWVNPNLKDSRVEIGGVTLPDFNRFSLHQFWGDISPFGPLAEVKGYTPDVNMTKSLAGMLGQQMRDLLNRTWTGEGREYKSGEARERGQVQDLFKGFNTRAAEAHVETQRKAMAEGLLGKALKQIPSSGDLPPGYVRWSDTVIDGLLRQHYAALGLDAKDYKQYQRELFNQKDQDRLERLAGGIAAEAGKKGDMMIHRTALEQLQQPIASQQINNALLRVLSKGLRGATAGFLANPFTVANYQLSEEIFVTMHTLKKALEGLMSLPFNKTQSKLSLYEAGNLAKGIITDRWYNPHVREVVPDEIFHGNHRFTTVAPHEFDKSPAELLREANVTGALLKLFRFANVDIRAKQRVAFASYLAHARLAWDDAQQAGSIPAGTQKGEWLRNWVMHDAPPEVHRQAYDTAVLVGHDYANVPPVLDEGHQWKLGGHDVTAIVNTLRPGFIPFAKYPYNLVRQGKRYTWDSVRDLLPGSAKTPQQKRAAIANLTMMSMMFLAARKLMDDDEDGVPQLGRSLDDLGKKLDGAYNTAGRLNITRTPLGRVMTAALDLFGLHDEAESDKWLRIRALPYASSTAALASLYGMARGKISQADTAENVHAVFADMVSEGILLKMMNAARDENGPFDQGKNLSYILAENAFDMATGRFAPPPLMHTAQALVDPLSHRTRPSPSLDYDPGAVEALRNKIPGAAKTLPTSGSVRVARDGSPKAEDAIAQTIARELPEGNFRRYVDPKDGRAKVAYVMPSKVQVRPRVLELIRAMGMNVKFLDRGEYERELAGVAEEK